MANLYQRGTIIFSFIGSNEELDTLIETNEIVTVNHWECNGQVAILIPEFADDVTCEDVVAMADHLQTGQFIHIQ